MNNILVSIPSYFEIGGLKVPVVVVVFAVLILIVLIALIAYRQNYRMQMRASLYMDSECVVYNRFGLEKYLKKNRKKFSNNRTLVVVEILNLEFLYSNYQKRAVLMKLITDLMLKKLSKRETLARIEFNRFMYIFDERNVNDIKSFCKDLEDRINNLDIEDYGKYTFNFKYGIYEMPKLLDIRKDIFMTLYILLYSNLSEENFYYYYDDVEEKYNKLQVINQMKEKAFEEKRFIPVVQPKVDLQTGKVCGGEVLCRWIDENGNIIFSYNDFINIFEGNGFIRQLDMLMFEYTCELAEKLSQLGHNGVILSVNISKVMFNDHKFISKVTAVLGKFNVNPANIEIEIREVDAMQNYQYMSQSIMELKALGFKVALDNFGKSYSSLNSLRNNPYDCINLDSIFFRDRLVDEKTRHIVEHILEMMNALNIKVVCEGIEDMDVLNTLSTINQDVIVQGYCISKPLQVQQFLDFVTRKFEFDFAPIIKYSKAAKELVDAKEKASNAEITELKDQISQLNILVANQTKSEAYEQEISLLKQQIDFLRTTIQNQGFYSQQQQPINITTTGTRNDEIEALKRELDAIKYGQYGRAQAVPTYDPEVARLRAEIDNLKQAQYQSDKEKTDAEMARLKSEIEALRNGQQLNVDELIGKINEANSEIVEEAKSLKKSLKKEREEREELEILLKGLNQGYAGSDEEEEDDEPYDDEEIDEDEADSDDDIDDGDKPIYSKNELEKIIEDLKNKYQEEWNVKAKEEMPDEFDKIVHDLKFYNKKRASFNDRLQKAKPEVRQMHDAIRSELLSYEKVANRTLNSYDAFYIGRKQIAKMSLTKTKVRVFLALDPYKYSAKQFPHRDVSSKKVHAKTPFLMMIKSNLSFKRLTKLIADLMTDNNCLEKTTNVNINDEEFKTSLNLKRKDS